MEIGFKGFDKDLCCRVVRYIPGATMPRIKRIKLCRRGYHFCRELKDLALWQWYKVDRESGNRFAVVEAGGVIHDGPGKSVAQEIRIIREMMIDEVLSLLDCGGHDNNGVGNDGVHNNGNMNHGDHNFGACNIGSNNIGICNLGNLNVGSFNSGNDNKGCFNLCNCSEGFFNTEDRICGVFNNKHVTRLDRIPTLLHELVYGWHNYAELTTMHRNIDFNMDELLVKSMEKSKNKMYKIMDWGMKGTIKQGVCRLLNDHAMITPNLWALKSELVMMPAFNWDIFEEITGISEKWLDTEIRKVIEAR